MNISKFFVYMGFLLLGNVLQAKVIYKAEIAYHNQYGSTINVKEYFYTSALSRHLALGNIDDYVLSIDRYSAEEMIEAIKDFIELSDLNVYSLSIPQLLAKLESKLQQRIYHIQLQLENNYSYDCESLVAASKALVFAAGCTVAACLYYAKYIKPAQKELHDYTDSLAKDNMYIDKKAPYRLHDRSKEAADFFDASSGESEQNRLFLFLKKEKENKAKHEKYMSLLNTLIDKENWNVLLGFGSLASYIYCGLKAYDVWKKDPNYYIQYLGAYKELLDFVEEEQQAHTS